MFRIMRFIFPGLISLIVLIGCTTSNKVEIPSETRFYDYDNSLIGSYESIEAIPDVYRDYLARSIRHVEETTGLNPFESVFDIYTNLDVDIQTDLKNTANRDIQNTSIIKENNSGKVIAFIDTDFNEETFIKEESYINSDAFTMYDYIFSRNLVFIPIVTYGLAFEYLNTSTADYVLDSSFLYPGTEISTYSEGDAFLGVIPIKQAFSEKLAAPTLRLNQANMDKAGYDTITEYLKGYSERDEELDLYLENHSIQYSTGQHAVKTETISNAYQMILNKGVYHETQFVNRLVHYSDKEVIEIELDYRMTQPLSSEASYLVSELLKHSAHTQAELSDIDDTKDYDLFGYGDYRTYIEGKPDEIWLPPEKRTKQVEMNVMVMGNVDYSIVTVSRYQDKEEAVSVNDFAQDRMNSMLNALESKFDITKEFEKPDGVIQTNYLPNSVNEEGIDTHSINSGNDSNTGYAKE